MRHSEVGTAAKLESNLPSSSTIPCLMASHPVSVNLVWFCEMFCEISGWDWRLFSPNPFQGNPCCFQIESHPLRIEKVLRRPPKSHFPCGSGTFALWIVLVCSP